MSAAAQSGEFQGLARTIIVLGASNVARGLGAAYCAAREALGTPRDFLFAAGQGRSFGQENSYFGRVLPGILHCGLWAAAAALPRRPVTAVITDLGNDIAYGVRPEVIAEWLDECLTRLDALGARSILTELPLESLRSLGPRRFELFRALLFPRATFDLDDMLRLAIDVNERVRAVAERHAATLVALPGEWYGWDPIHIRRRRAAHAWRTIWAAGEARDAPRVSTWFDAWRRWRTHRNLCRALPLERVQRGRVERQSQPTHCALDGALVWCF